MKKYLSYGFVMLGAACWGFIGLFNRTLGEAGMSVMNRVFVRNFPSLLLLTLAFAVFHREVFRIRLRHLPLFAASGFISVLGLALTYFNCQMECSLAVAAILLYLAPSIVVVMSALLWKTPITRRKVAALVLSLLGCALVSGVVGGELTGTVRGLAFGVGAAFCYATYTIFAHYVLTHYDSYTMIYWTFVFAGLGSFAFLDWPTLAPVWETTKGMVGSLGLVVVATVLPYLFYTKGLEGVEGGKAAILANVEPVVAALTGVLVFHETLSGWTLAGVVCVLTGVVLLAKDETKEAADHGKA